MNMNLNEYMNVNSIVESHQCRPKSSIGDLNDENESVQSKLICGFTKRQARIGAALAVLSFIDVISFSIFTPFFPIVAEQKHLTPLQIGVIFSSYSMAGIFGSLITGSLLVRIGAKFIIISGIACSTGGVICFGLLKLSPSEYFFVMCLLCRLLMGFASACTYTALFAVIFQEFADRSLTVIGISEALCSIGGVLGPLVGGSLYTLGGYMLPFFVLGGLLSANLVVVFFLIPPVVVEKQTKTVSPARLLLHINGIFGSLFVVLSFIISSFILSNLTEFLTHSVSSIFYGISTPLFGYIADSKKCGPHIMAIGGIFCGITMSFYGLNDFLRNIFGWEGTRQWFVYVMNGVIGVCMAAITIPTFEEMLVAAREMKLHSNVLAQNGLVSGLWNTMYSIGDIIGPTVGAVMVQKYNFENTCTIFGIMILIVGILKSIHLIVIKCKRGSASVDSSEEDDEREPLLNKENYTLHV